MQAGHVHRGDEVYHPVLTLPGDSVTERCRFPLQIGALMRLRTGQPLDAPGPAVVIGQRHVAATLTDARGRDVATSLEITGEEQASTPKSQQAGTLVHALRGKRRLIRLPGSAAVARNGFWHVAVNVRALAAHAENRAVAQQREGGV